MPLDTWALHNLQVSEHIKTANITTRFLSSLIENPPTDVDKNRAAIELLYEGIKNMRAVDKTAIISDFLKIPIPTDDKGKELMRLIFKEFVDMLPFFQKNYPDGFKKTYKEISTNKEKIGDMVTPDQWKMIENLAQELNQNP